MKLHEFLHFNNTCPICSEPLHLFAQGQGSSNNGSWCYQANQIEPNVYKFSSYNNKNIDNENYSNAISSSDNNIIMIESDNSIDLKFSNEEMIKNIERKNMLFYFVCNPNGIKKSKYSLHDISAYKACYYRSFPFLTIKNNELQLLESENDNLTITHETYCFKLYEENLEKIYILDLNFSIKETTLWFYTISEDNRKDIGFRPNIFEKKMPLLNNRPAVEDRDKFIKRLDGWILLS